MGWNSSGDTVENERGKCPHCGDTVEENELRQVHENIQLDGTVNVDPGDYSVTVDVVDEDGNRGTYELSVDDITDALKGYHEFAPEYVDWS